MCTVGESAVFVGQTAVTVLLNKLLYMYCGTNHCMFNEGHTVGQTTVFFLWWDKLLYMY